MATRVSPGVYINVFDFTDYVPQLGTATLCVVGGATKGPLNTPTLVLNESELVRAFGPPMLTDFALQAAVQFLKKGSRLVFCRVATGALAADVPVPGLASGTPATAAVGTIAFDSSLNPADADTISISDKVPTANLNNDNVGAAGNVTITLAGTGVTGRIAVTGMAGGTVSARAVGTVKLIGSAVPVDADRVTISDGTTVKTFEFDDNSSVIGSNVLVTIVAGDPYATMANLITAINAFAFNVSGVAGHATTVFEFDSNASVVGGHIGVLIGASAAATLLNLISAINTHPACGATAINATVTVPELALTSKMLGIDGNALVEKSGANILITGLAGAVAAVSGSAVTVLSVEALNPGTWGNGIQVVARATTTLGAPADNFDLLVYAPVDSSGTLGLVEQFSNMSADSSDARYVETAVAEGIAGEFNKSNYILVDVLSNAGTVTPGTYALATGGGTVGTDGVSGLAASDYIGSVSGTTATGLQAVRNAERVEFNILAVPGISHKDVIAEMLDLAANRNDCMVIVDPPIGATRDQIIDWHNGTSTIFANSPTTPLDSRFGALYWSWIKQEDKYNKKTLFMPPSGLVAAAWAFNDQVAGAQFAPAGHTRGLVDGLAVEFSPEQEDRDLLVGDQNRVNPIVDFIQGGLTIFGNRTLQRKRTALDNVHTQRMLIFAMKLVATAAKFLVFEPNDEITWRKFTALVNPILESLKAGRGIDQLFVLCDASTNPPAQRQNKIMKGIIKIRPVDAAEILSIDFDLFATGATFSGV